MSRLEDLARRYVNARLLAEQAKRERAEAIFAMLEAGAHTPLQSERARDACWSEGRHPDTFCPACAAIAPLHVRVRESAHAQGVAYTRLMGEVMRWETFGPEASADIQMPGMVYQVGHLPTDDPQPPDGFTVVMLACVVPIATARELGGKLREPMIVALEMLTGVET